MTDATGLMAQASAVPPPPPPFPLLPPRREEDDEDEEDDDGVLNGSLYEAKRGSVEFVLQSLR